MPPPSEADTTPSARMRDRSLISAAAKKRVDKIYPSGRCLIENVPAYNEVQYAHCLPRGTKDVTLTLLERAWKMPYRTLNLDTRRNIIRLGSVKHGLFDKNAWILLPEDEIIQLYYDTKDAPDRFPTLERDSYKYRFVPHPAMKSSLIYCQARVEQPGEVLSNTDCIVHKFPFNNFSPIESHLHPKFVIARIGRALAKGALLAEYLRTHPHLLVPLTNITVIYEAWTTRRKGDSTSGEEDVFDHQDEDDEDDDDDDDEDTNSTVTRARRKKRKGKKPPQYYGPSTQKRQRNEQTDGLWLDDETLREFDKEMPPEQVRQSKRIAVEHWLSRLEPDSANVV